MAIPMNAEPGHLPLFRPAAIERAAVTGMTSPLPPTSGKISLAIIFGGCLSVILAGLVLNLPYTEWADARGQLVNSGGLGEIHAPKSGSIERFVVDAGASVKAGQVIAFLTPAEGVGDDRSMLDLSIRSFGDQARHLDAQRKLIEERIASLELVRRQSRINLRRQMNAMSASIGEERSIADGVASLTAAKEQIYARGFLSRIDLLQAKRDVGASRQRILSLEQARDSLERDGLMTDARTQQDISASYTELERTSQQRAELTSEIAKVKIAARVPIRAPTSGIIRDLQSRSREFVSSGQLLAVVSPKFERFDAVLFADARMASFVKPNDELRVELEPFPQEQFGWQVASVDQVDAVGVSETTGSSDRNEQRRLYRIRAHLLTSDMHAFGRKVRLKVGTPVTARLAIRRQSIFMWIIDPLRRLGRIE